MKKKSFFLFLLLIFALWVSVPAQIITTVAGNGTTGYSGDGGPAITAQFNNPISVALDAGGNMYVSDFNNHRIRKINAGTGIITTIAGTGIAGFSGDGGPAINAQINNPTDLCADASGNIYFADNQNFRIRKIDAATGNISTVVGNGTGSYAGQTIPATTAGIGYPNGLAVDASNLYVSLFTSARICKLDLSSGILSTIGGTGVNGYSGDGGPAINATFGYPAGLSVTAAGDVYVADYNNNRIRKIDAAGIVTTVAGNGIAAFAGDGGLAINASINLPTGVFADAGGNIFIADRNNYLIRKVAATSGIITTVAGSGNYGYGGDGGSAVSPCTKLADPHKVRVDAAGNMFISDQSNSRIRKVDTSPVPSGSPTINIAASATTVCAGTAVTFNAVVTNAGANPVYQWKINGIATGSNSSSYNSSLLSNGDIVTCQLTSTTACGPVTVGSNAITITVTTALVPAITIVSNTTAVCQGGAVTFNATPVNGGAAPLYQWQINGITTGTNSTVYTNTTLSNGDAIKCILTSNAACATPATATSNIITITVNPLLTPAVSITASAVNICSGSAVTFTAAPTNSGNNPVYQWKINNVNAGTNNAVFTTTTLQNNDIVSCSIVTDPALPCVITNTATSNTIAITVSAATSPVVTISASSNFICQGSPVTFTAVPQNAGTAPSYTWKVNGVSTGTNNTVYFNNNFSNGDQVMCVLAANNATCPLSAVSSNIITMVIKSLPVITLGPVNAIVLQGSQVQLNATVSGNISLYQWTPQSLLVNPFVLNPLTKPLDSSTIFTFSVTSTEGCTAMDQVAIQVYKTLQMPSAFTPNNDGVNDIFRIPPGVLLTLSEFSVYDRWGNRVFTTTDITKGWDGKNAGSPFNTGVFIYIINGESQGKKVFLKGSFTLLR